MVGTSCNRYATMKESVASLTVVLADGTVVKAKHCPRKSSANYKLTGLITGSESTLGIITEITLRLHVQPKQETAVEVSFPAITNASNTVADIVHHGIQVNAVELLDDKMMEILKKSGEYK